MNIEIDYRAATILNEAATETKYLKILGKQVSGTALLGLFFFSRLLDNCETTIFALTQNRKWDAICTLYPVVMDVATIGTYTLAHLVTCVTALFYQAHYMHNYLKTKELTIKDPELEQKQKTALQEATAQLNVLRMENAQLQQVINNPHIMQLRRLKTFIVENLSGNVQNAAVSHLIDKIIEAVYNKQAEFPLNKEQSNLLVSAFNFTKTEPETAERTNLKEFFRKVIKNWNEIIQVED